MSALPACLVDGTDSDAGADGRRGGSRRRAARCCLPLPLVA